MESNHFMLECASICPETTHQKLESQHNSFIYYDCSSNVIGVCDCVSFIICPAGRELFRFFTGAGNSL